MTIVSNFITSAYTPTKTTILYGDFKDVLKDLEKLYENQSSSNPNLSINVDKEDKFSSDYISSFDNVNTAKLGNYFSNAMNSGIKSANEIDFKIALNKLKDEAKDILNFVIQEQGINSELGYDLHSLYSSLEYTVDFYIQGIDSIKNLADNKDISLDENTGTTKLVNELNNFFGANYDFLSAFFDYAQNKISGFDEEGVLDSLLTVKGFLSSNSKENMSFADGTSLELVNVKNSDGSTDTYLGINGEYFMVQVMKEVKLKEHSKKLENEKFEVLFDMLKTQQTSFNNIYEYNQTKNTNSNKENILASLLKDTSMLKDSLYKDNIV